jgi:excinuclease ABC subunit C
LLDGGRGQLNAVCAVARRLEVADIPLCAIAKGPQRHAGRERLFLPARREPLILPYDAPELFLLQKIRDEAHRFAVSYHRLRRQKQQRHSALDHIPGIGKKRKQALLRHFGSVQKIRASDAEALMAVPGVSQHLADRIIQFFQEEA